MIFIRDLLDVILVIINLLNNLVSRVLFKVVTKIVVRVACESSPGFYFNNIEHYGKY